MSEQEKEAEIQENINQEEIRQIEEDNIGVKLMSEKKSWNISIHWSNCPSLTILTYYNNKCYHHRNNSKICSKENCPIKLTDLWGN